MKESDVIEFCETISTERLEQLTDSLNSLLSLRKRNEEMQKRNDSGETKKCFDCEYGKFGPCKYRHWGFMLYGSDPACSDFQEWGLVF